MRTRLVPIEVDTEIKNGTVARKFSIGELYICAWGLDITKSEENSTDL